MKLITTSSPERYEMALYSKLTGAMPVSTIAAIAIGQGLVGTRAITLISKSNPESQLTPIAVQLG